jgi:phenylacetate-CoA ligase
VLGSSIPFRWAAGLEVLAQAPHWSRSELLDFQTRRLRALVRHAARRVPYYRRLFRQAGLDPAGIRSLDDLPRIPITSRADLQQLPAGEVVAAGLDPNKLVLHSTSGSSGEPLRIWRTSFEEYLLRACRIRIEFAAGLRPADRWVAVGFVRRPPRTPPFHSRLGILHREQVDCLLPAEEMLSQIRALNPHVLGGYAGSIANLTGAMTEEDRARIRPRLILIGAETLTPHMRERISRTFGVPVFERYGSHEFGTLACQCPRGGRFHVAEHIVILEALRDGRPAGPGEEGEVVATALHSFAAPLIRYRLNDLVTVGQTPCPCGAPVSTLTRILGRTIEQFLLPNGKLLHPYALVLPLFDEAPWVRRYQIVQDRADHILIKIVPLTNPGAEAVAAVARSLEAALEGQMAVEIELVDDIPPEPNGKYRPYYSLVTPARAER